jgi:acetyl esterase/lipase
MITLRSIYWDEPLQAERVLDIFDAEGPPSRNVALLFVHGGGWRSGSRTVFHGIAQAYREAGFDCASTDYRLDGVTLDEQVEDVRRACAIFAEDLRRRGRPAEFVLIGSSAGAHLALLSALGPGAPDGIKGLCVQAAPFTFEPWEDIFPGIWSSMQTAVGASYSASPEKYREASPLHHVREGMPPIFALHAANEHMFPFQLTEQFAAAATQCGARVDTKIYPATEHGFFYALTRWQQREALIDIIRFIDSL